MSRKRKKPIGKPSGAPPRPLLKPIVLDSSTTETDFLYFGSKEPSATMRMVAEVASEQDREWFKANPGASYRVRWSLPGEFPTEGMEAVRGDVDASRARFAMVVLQMAPGARRRIPTVLFDGAATSEPIPVEVWGKFHEAAVARDQDAAIRSLAQWIAEQ